MTELNVLIEQLNGIFIQLEDLLGTTAETDALEIAIQDLEEVAQKQKKD